MLADRQKRSLAFAALLCAGLALAGCSSQIADMPLVGTPTDAPARPKEPGSFLPVNDLPAHRNEAAVHYQARHEIQAELVAARDRQAAANKDAAAAAK